MKQPVNLLKQDLSKQRSTVLVMLTNMSCLSLSLSDTQTLRRFVLSLQIYTDWANHYLAKSGCPRLIKDLSQDVTDGVLLAQIIQIIGRHTHTPTHTRLACSPVSHVSPVLCCSSSSFCSSLQLLLRSSYSLRTFTPFSCNLHNYHDRAENLTRVREAASHHTSGVTYSV